MSLVCRVKAPANVAALSLTEIRSREEDAFTIVSGWENEYDDPNTLLRSSHPIEVSGKKIWTAITVEGDESNWISTLHIVPLGLMQDVAISTYIFMYHGMMDEVRDVDHVARTNLACEAIIKLGCSLPLVVYEGWKANEIVSLCKRESTLLRNNFYAYCTLAELAQPMKDFQ
tara:strand:+ start:36007 stop:36522 length:516 start_codon:yes stop_codon:yes gene_type:complete